MPRLLARLLAAGPGLTALRLATPLLAALPANAISQAPVPSPNLDFSQLGRVAVAGDFDFVSLYQYEGQNEDVLRTNGSQSLLTTFPDGAFETMAMADGSIEAMCPFIVDGSLTGVIVAGNFTSLGEVQAQGIALWNPNTTRITTLPGLSGQVSAVYCDADRSMIYVGGAFTGSNSTNAIAWTTGWTNLPFAGFNGPVNSITKNEAGNIVFGGQFTGLGNATTPTEPDEQVVNLGSGNITAVGSTSTNGFQDPRNVICKTGATDGPGNTWLLADNTGGYWQGSFGFGFNPTKLRLYNTQYQGRGTKMFYFEELNTGGVLNMNYIDPEGRNQSCSTRCPLPQNNVTYQDFHFSPPVGMNMFRIWVAEWYGDGGGFSGIELFQDDIYSFAINDFNEPRCDHLSSGASSAANPSSLWQYTASKGMSNSDFLTADIQEASEISPQTSVVFRPNLKQSGNYTITVYTPGCVAYNDCSARGMVNMTASVTANERPITSTLYQTNNYDKFDQIFYGHIDVDSSFMPTVTLTPQAGQSVPLTVVAQRVRFQLISSSGGLNGLYEYNPQRTDGESDFSSSAINRAGGLLDSGAVIDIVWSSGDDVFVAGNFSGHGISNVMSISDNATALPGGGLNAAVRAAYENSSLIYLGGAFTNLADNSASGLNYVAAFDTGSNEWKPLGAGVNGLVNDIVPVAFNVSGSDRVECITISGDFTSVQGFGENQTFGAQGFAVWVPSRGNWLNNLPDADLSVRGNLDAFTTVPGFSNLYAGQLFAQGTGLSNAVELVGSGEPTLEGLGVDLNATSSTPAANSSTLHKRYLNTDREYAGVYTGLFYNENNLNLTILGGSFSAQSSNGSSLQNLIFINDTRSTESVQGLSGLDSNSAFLAMDTYETTLFAGGAITGKIGNNDVNGLVVYDLAAAQYATTQPPALTGSDVVVHAVAARPSSSHIFVGGNFSGAGSLPCSALCFYDTAAQQWNSPGSGLSGVVSGMTWSSNDQLILAGNLSLGGNATTMATFNAKTQDFAPFSGASSLPGPISVFSVASSNYNQFWVAGIATANDSAYLSKYDGNAWAGVGGLGEGTHIHGLQILTVNSNHDNSDLMPNNEVLMLTGNINIPGFGNASACLFNGTSYQPFLLTNRADGGQGTISTLFVSNPQNFMKTQGGHLALGLIVLIGLAIALGLIFMLVVIGILVERHRRRREGYIPMSMDRNGNLERIPPESLLGGIASKGSPPRI